MLRLAAFVSLFLVALAFPAEPPCPNPHCCCAPVCTCGPSCDCGYSYALAYKEAVQKSKPLVVFVQQVPQAVPGCVVCRHDRYSAQKGAGVWLGLPDGQGGLDEVAHREGTPAAAVLRTWVQSHQREVRGSSLLFWTAPRGGYFLGGCGSGG